MGMYIEFLAKLKLSLFMKDYIEESIDLFGEKISTAVSSPEKKGLQNIYYNTIILENKYADILHSIVAKLLWVEKGGRSNTETAILLLYTIVAKITN